VKISHAQITGAYQAWLANIATATGAGGNLRVQDPMSANQTTSEGIAYGMLIAVYMADKGTFDKLWGFAQAHMTNGLMDWLLDSSGNPVNNASNNGTNSASDADEDMAWALLMADKQWPGGPYGTSASTLIRNIKSKDINGSNNVTDGDYTMTSSHPDYAAPNYYKVFATVSGDSGWNTVYSTEYSQLTGSQNGTTGLIPDAVNGGGTGTFGYDACRAPWRVGLDYCWSASAQAKTLLTPMVAYFMQTSQNGSAVSNIKIPMPIGGGTGQNASGAITGPAAIAAMMSASNQTFVNGSWTYLYSLVNNGTSVGNLNYFSSTLGLISMLALSGNFVDYTPL
jgi:endo-1,4-beta-D-glucanase Y